MKNKLKKNGLVEGTVIAYIAIVFIKVLGALYVIPFYKIIGESGGVLYSYAYNIYNLFLNISTSGIPVAISIVISEYRALKLFKTKEKALSIANKAVFVLSFVAFIILFVFAKNIGGFFVNGLSGGNSIDDVALVIRAVSFCLLIIPFLSVIKGYLQGHKYIAVTSYSQVIEQIVRIFVVLVGSYIAINLLHNKVSVGVCVALSGAFFGGLVAYLYLKRKIAKNKKLFEEIDENKDEQVLSSNTIFKKIVTYAIPVIIIAITQNLYEITDMKLAIKGLYMIGYSAANSELLASIVVTWAPKICMVISGVGMGLSISIIPYIVSSYVKKDYKDVNKKFNQSVNIVLAITIPIAIGLIVLAKPVYYMFYGTSPYGYEILRVLAIVNIPIALHGVVNMALQGMGKYKLVYFNTIVGLIINAMLDIPIILLFNRIGISPYLGTLIATLIGQSISLLIVFLRLKKDMSFNYKEVGHLLLKMLGPCVLMTALIVGANILIPLTNVRYLIVVLGLVVYAIIGAVVYFYCMYMNHGLYDAFGEDSVNRVLKKLKLSKLIKKEKQK